VLFILIWISSIAQDFVISWILWTRHGTWLWLWGQWKRIQVWVISYWEAESKIKPCRPRGTFSRAPSGHVHVFLEALKVYTGSNLTWTNYIVYTNNFPILTYIKNLHFNIRGLMSYYCLKKKHSRVLQDKQVRVAWCLIITVPKVSLQIHHYS
jgi:hypothetical protein